jgi:hypothetical protein
LRSATTSLAKWGKKLLAKKGAINLAVAAVARKLTVAVWYLLMGRWTPLEEIDDRLCVKVSKIIGQVGQEGLDKLGKTRKNLREQAYQLLKSIKTAAPDPKDKPASESQTQAGQLPEAAIYILGPRKNFTPKAKAKSLAPEYGVA